MAHGEGVQMYQITACFLWPHKWFSILNETQEVFCHNNTTLQVISTNPRFCKVAILGVESTSLKEPFKGTIRKEDVRATEKDKVEMYKSFRPGDIALARVLTLHTQTYLLSTAENELGVVFAKSEAGR